MSPPTPIAVNISFGMNEKQPKKVSPPFFKEGWSGQLIIKYIAYIISRPGWLIFRFFYPDFVFIILNMIRIINHPGRK
jgi:hypothetical protein